MKNIKLIAESATMFKALGNAKRLEIIYVLRGKERKVGELEKMLHISQSALSQHLAVLRAADIVSTRREAQFVYYSLTNARCKHLLDFLDSIYS